MKMMKIHKYKNDGYLRRGIRFYNSGCGRRLTVRAAITEIWGRVTCSDCLELGGYEPIPENRRRDAVMATRLKNM